MSYYYLACRTCAERFEPVLCTEENELLIPDYDACRESAGESNTHRLEVFHEEHRGHDLVEIEHDTSTTRRTSTPKPRGQMNPTT